MYNYFRTWFEDNHVPCYLVTPSTREIVPHLVLGGLSLQATQPNPDLLSCFRSSLGITNSSEDTDPFAETPAHAKVAAWENKHAASILAMRNCGTLASNHNSLTIADDLLLDAKDEFTSEEFALLVAGSVGRWRFAAVWKTLRSHILNNIEAIWLDKVQPNLDNIYANEFQASLESAMMSTGVNVEEVRLLIKCVMIGKPSVAMPLDVYIENGGYSGSPEDWEKNVAFWLDFPKAKELLKIFSAYG